MDLTKLQKGDKTRRRQPVDTSSMVYGKVPPQAKELEEAVLGAILLEKGAFDAVSDILKPESFYVDAHQRIFRAMQSLAQKSQPLDLLTVVEELRRREELDIAGGPYAVTKLTNGVVSSANIESHSRIIFQKHLQRELIRIGGELITEAYEDSTDVFDLLEATENNLYGITSNSLKKDFRHINGGLVKVLQKVEELRFREAAITGVPSGFREIDKVTNGWQNTDLIILAARPAVGKTAFALNLARNAAMSSGQPTGVGIFSMEMSEHQLLQRMMAAESGIYLERIMKGRVEESHMKVLYEKGVQALSQAPIYIDDTAGLTMFELRAKARRMKSKHQVGLIIVDYLQLMTGDSNDSKNREREISKISRELKKLAKDLEVPIIALSQLSREIEKRSNKEPQLSDLRESGAIEQDADLVMFLYRPSAEDVKKDPDLKDKGMIKIAKHRNGRLDDFVLNFYGEIQKWTDLEEEMTPPQTQGAGTSASGTQAPALYLQSSKHISDLQEEDDPF